jgi:hypothetical protein
MRSIFKGIDSAYASPDGALFETVCATSLESLAFICNSIKAVKPAVVMSFLMFWFWEMRKYCALFVFTALIVSSFHLCRHRVH